MQSEFSEAQISLAGFALAMGHPARIAIVELLQEWGEAPCGRIVEALPLAQATVSQHLRCLTSVGILRPRVCGKKVCYSLDEEILFSFCHHFQKALGTDKPPLKRERTPCCP